MTTLTEKDVKKIAHLARIEIDPETIPEHVESLSNIINFVEQINNVNTDAIKPMAHPQNICQRLRPDEVTEKDQHKLFQDLAPQTEAELYLVPKVIDACEVS